jgi:hypothetical protein
MESDMLIERIVAGGLLLVLGRKLFWLYLAILGFVTGLTMSSRYFHVQPEWLQIVIGIGVGILGALLAYFFQGVAVLVAGFEGGGSIATSLLTVFAYNTNHTGDALFLGVFITGGVIGAILALVFFDWALIILTSLAGALLILDGLKLTMPGAWLMALALFIVGVVAQASIQRPVRRKKATRARNT